MLALSHNGRFCLVPHFSQLLPSTIPRTVAANRRTSGHLVTIIVEHSQGSGVFRRLYDVEAQGKAQLFSLEVARDIGLGNGQITTLSEPLKESPEGCLEMRAGRGHKSHGVYYKVVTCADPDSPFFGQTFRVEVRRRGDRAAGIPGAGASTGTSTQPHAASALEPAAAASSSASLPLRKQGSEYDVASNNSSDSKGGKKKPSAAEKGASGSAAAAAPPRGKHGGKRQRESDSDGEEGQFSVEMYDQANLIYFYLLALMPFSLINPSSNHCRRGGRRLGQ